MQEFIQHLINGINLGSIYALIALGYTMVYGIMQMINFAHADVYMFGAFISYYVAKWFDLSAHSATSPNLFSFFFVLLSSILGCALLGYLINKWAYEPLRNAPRSNALITAIGVSLLLQYTGQFLFGADPKLFPTVLENQLLFSIYSIEIHLYEVIVLGVSLIVLFFLNFIIYKTQLGRALRAVSCNSLSATLVGISRSKMIGLTFVIGSALAGTGSVLVGLTYPKIDPLMGTLFGIKSFVAAVFGGIGNLQGAVLGGLIMGLSEQLVVGYISSTYRDALAFGLLILILTFKPTGLLGTTQQEKV